VSELAGFPGLAFKHELHRDGIVRDLGRGRHENLSGAHLGFTFGREKVIGFLVMSLGLEIQKAALKDSHSDDRQGIDCHEKGQRRFQSIFPLLLARYVLSDQENPHVIEHPGCGLRARKHRCTTLGRVGPGPKEAIAGYQWDARMGRNS
jgi:hypothetical protein